MREAIGVQGVKVCRSLPQRRVHTQARTQTRMQWLSLTHPPLPSSVQTSKSTHSCITNLCAASLCRCVSKLGVACAKVGFFMQKRVCVITIFLFTEMESCTHQSACAGVVCLCAYSAPIHKKGRKKS